MQIYCNKRTILTVFGCKMTSYKWQQNFKFNQCRNKYIIFKEHDEIEKCDITLWKSLTKWAFQKIFNSWFCRVVLFIFHIISWNFNFAVNHVTSSRIFPPKAVKIEKQKKRKQKHTMVWNTKFYNPAKFELKQIKTIKVVSRVLFQA